MSLAPGTRIGPYEIVSIVGAGGMGEVYRATDTKLHRVVALKILSAHLDQGGLRLLQEARAASALNHPHICTVHEVVESAGRAFIVMEYVDGTPLSDMIAKQPLPIETAMRLGIQVADALAHAHDRGIVHRDLKPSNVVITRDGRAKVIDFGLAVRGGDGLTDQVSTRTSLGESDGLAGTLSYMAPEVLKGQASGVASDIWALGVTLYAMISGALPFRGKTAFELTAAIQYEPAQPLPTRVPDGVRTIVMRCLTKEPSHRFHGASEIRAALETIRLDDPGVSPPRRSGVDRRVAAAIVLVLLSFGAGAAIWTLSRVDLRNPPTIPRDVVSVLIVDFKNDTGDRAFDGIIEQMLSSSIEDSSSLVIHSRPLASRQPLDESAGRALAIREGITAVVSGHVALAQPGYVLSATITDPALNKPLVRTSANAPARVNVAEAVESVAREIRIRLGDSSVSTGASPGRGSFEAWRSLTVSRELASSGNWDAASQYARRAVQEDPQFARGYLQLFMSLDELGKDDEAAAIGSQLVSVASAMRERERHRTLGTYYLMISDYRNAREQYEALLKRYPDDVAGHNNLALICFYQHDLPAALQAIRRAVEIFPQRALFRSNYALLAMYASDFDTAAAEARVILSQDAGSPTASVALAIAMLDKSNVTAARQTYGQMADRNRGLASLGLSDLALYIGDAPEAERILTSQMTAPATSLETSGRVYVLFAETYVAQGKTVAAIDAVRKALDLNRNLATIFSAARVFLEARQYSDATSLASDLAKMEGSVGLAYAKIIEAEAASKAHNLSRSIAALQLTDEVPDLWLRRFALALKYVEIGEYAKALAELEICETRRGEAAAIFFDDTPTFRYLRTLPYWFGRTQSGLGMKTPAAESFRKFLRVQSSSAPDALVEDARKRLASLGEH